MHLKDFIKEQSWIIILNSVLPGQNQWSEYLQSGGSCKESCPSFATCRGSGPGSVCSNNWPKAEASPNVLYVLFHVLNNFDYYNRDDLKRLKQESPQVAELRAHVHGLAVSSTDDFEEGSTKLRSHFYRDRKSTAASRLKKLAMASETVVCKGCKTDFYEKYGNDCMALIDCHHIVPISKAEHGGKTKVNDLILLCANCHRLIHSQHINLNLKDLEKYVSGG